MSVLQLPTGDVAGAPPPRILKSISRTANHRPESPLNWLISQAKNHRNAELAINP
jgi:hypothetical protein